VKERVVDKQSRASKVEDVMGKGIGEN